MRMKLWRRCYLLVTILALTNIGAAALQAEEVTPLKCYVIAQWNGGPTKSPIRIGDDATLFFRAVHTAPTTKKECTVESAKFTWALLKVERTSTPLTEKSIWDDKTGDNTAYDLESIKFNPNSTENQNTILTMKFKADGLWRVTVQATANWKGKKKDPECPTCDACQDCVAKSNLLSTYTNQGEVEVLSGCRIDEILFGNPKVCINKMKQFEAKGGCLDDVKWTAQNGSPPIGTGATFKTYWNTPGKYSVTAKCGDNGTPVNENVEVVERAIPQNVNITVTPNDPALTSHPEASEPALGTNTRHINYLWDVNISPAQPTAYVYTHYSVSWDFVTTDTSETNSGSESYYFEGIADDMQINLQRIEVYNTFSDFLWAYYNMTEPVFNILKRNKDPIVKIISDEYKKWQSRNIGGNNCVGLIHITAEYKYFSCPADEVFYRIPNSLPNGLPRSRSVLLPGYPYLRPANTLRLVHRDSLPHLAAPPSRWTDTPLATGSISKVIICSQDGQGNLSIKIQ